MQYCRLNENFYLIYTLFKGQRVESEPFDRMTREEMRCIHMPVWYNKGTTNQIKGIFFTDIAK